MQKQQRWRRLIRIAVLVGATLGLAWGGQTVARADDLAIPDISEWQGQLSDGQVAALKNQVAFVINRRQYGAAYQDKFATNNTALFTKYGIPFGEYDYARFTSAASARREAQVFYERANGNAQFYVLDFEENDVTSGTTNGAVRAWLHQMRALTNKHLIFYSYQSFATTYADTARQDFDAQWIANYSNEPTIPLALWQYTDHAYLSALGEYTDNSRAITAVQPVTWWTDSETVALTHTPEDSDSRTPATPATNPTVSAASVNTVPAATSSAKPVFGGFRKHQRVYLHKAATTYADGSAIPVRVRQRVYTISAVKGETTGRTHQALYIKALHKWVRAQDVTGYWAESGSFRLTHKLYLYRNARLTRRTGGYYVAGDHVKGRIVRNPNGRGYVVKTRLGYLTSNVQNLVRD